MLLTPLPGRHHALPFLVLFTNFWLQALLLLSCSSSPAGRHHAARSPTWSSSCASSTSGPLLAAHSSTWSSS
eukprot:10958363-Heterocapsa_arctica.AAC.1